MQGGCSRGNFISYCSVFCIALMKKNRPRFNIMLALYCCILRPILFPLLREKTHNFGCKALWGDWSSEFWWETVGLLHFITFKNESDILPVVSLLCFQNPVHKTITEVTAGLEYGSRNMDGKHPCQFWDYFSTN